MPVPIVAAVPFAARVIAMLIARFKALGFLEWAGIASLIDTILSYNVKQELYKIVAEEMSARAGLELNPDDPFSDASVAGAVGQKVGITLRSMRDVQMIKEDIDTHLARELSQKTGYAISTVSDVARLKGDLLRIGSIELTTQLGLPVGVFPREGEDFSPDVVRENLLAWAKAELANKTKDTVGYSVDEIMAMKDFEALAGELNGRLREIGSVQSVEARRIAICVADKMGVEAVQEYQARVFSMSKAARKKELNRQAQKRFRATRGNRQIYVPLGMSATVT